MPRHSVRFLCLAGLLSFMLGTGLVHAADPYDPWPGLVQDIFKDRPIHDGTGVIAIEMPYRAEDAAIVPVTLRSRLSPDDSLVLAMEGGISLSEDPNIRFTYASNGAKRFRAEARDTQGHLFRNEWKIDDSGM